MPLTLDRIAVAQESEIFVPPAAGWGAGGGEDSATCPGSSHSADSMGTPQSHFKARPRGGKRSRGAQPLLIRFKS